MSRKFSILLIVAWFILTPLTLAGSVILLNKNMSGGIVLAAKSGPYDLFSAQPPYLGGVAQEITSGDARPHLVEKFLKKYNSPIQGHGAYFVEMADKYGIDWKLVAAIGFQESILGKVIPPDSYNAWGWAIYTGKKSGAAFDSWPHAIKTVTKGLAQNYYGRGLKTPEQIMTRYAPDSNGS